MFLMPCEIAAGRPSAGRAYYKQNNQEYSFVSFRKVEFDVWEMMGRTKDTSAAKKQLSPLGWEEQNADCLLCTVHKCSCLLRQEEEET